MNERLTEVGEVADAAMKDPKPITVSPSPVMPMVGVLLRQIALMGGALATLFTLFSERDIRGLFDYIGTDEFLSFTLMLVGLASLLWGQFRELRIWKKLVTLAEEVPDEIATIIRKLPFIRS